MESEIEEECVEVAAFISKTNREFLGVAAAPNNDPGCRTFAGCLGNSQAVSGQILVKEGREGGKAYGKRCGVGIWRAACTQVGGTEDTWVGATRCTQCQGPKDHLGKFPPNPGGRDPKEFPCSIQKEITLVHCLAKGSNPPQIYFRGLLLVLSSPQTSAGVCGEDEQKGLWGRSDTILPLLWA